MKNKKAAIKNILATVLGAAIPALASAPNVHPVVRYGAGIVMSLGFLHTTAPKDEY